MNNRDEYVAKLKTQLELWEKQMIAWEDAARSATRDARTEMEKQMGIMRSRFDDMTYRMELLRGASQDAWQEIARAAEESRKTMQDAFDKARTRFKDV